MKKKVHSPRKHIPQRTCVACHIAQDKRTLIRIVRTKDGVRIDQTGKLNGRGAYLHNSRHCWEQALKGKLEQALRMEFSKEDIQILTEIAKKLPDDAEPEKKAQANS